MMSDMMTFPDTWEEYEKSYGFDDSEEIYTNGSRLIPSFRVKQWLEHLPSAQPERTGNWVEIGDEPYDEWECDRCGFVIDGSGCIDPEEYRDIYIFCPHCGAKMLKEGEEHETD